MSKHLGALAIIVSSALFSTSAQATCPTFHTITNGTTADATHVMDNFNYVLCSPTFTETVSGPNFTIGGSGNGISYQANNAYGAGLDITNIYGGTSRTWDIRVDGGSLTGQVNSFVIYDNTAYATRLAIDTTGKVGIGTASPSYMLHVNGSVAGTSAYNNLSDARLKKDVRPIFGALGLIERLQGVRFNWRVPQEREVGAAFDLPTDRPQIGFIAQEVGSVLPEAVTVADGKDAIMSMEETKIVPLLVEAIKELKASNEAEISKLQRDIAELRRGPGNAASDDTLLHHVALALGWR